MTEDRLVVRLTIDLTSDVAQLVELLLLTLKNEIAEEGTIKLGDIAVPNSLLRALRRVQRAVLHDCRGTKGAKAYGFITPETQQLLANAAGTMFLSQQRGLSA